MFLNSHSQIGRVKEYSYSLVSVTCKDTKKNLRSYPWQNKSTEEGTEVIPQRRDGPSQEKADSERMRYRDLARHGSYVFISWV